MFNNYVYGDTPHQNSGSKETFSNAVVCELEFLKIEPAIKDPLFFSVRYENLISADWCRLTLAKEFLHISGVVLFTIKTPVRTSSH